MRKEGRNKEEDDLHDPYGKGSLQHGACFVDVHSEVVGLVVDRSKRAKGHADGTAIPMRTVRPRDETKLVDAGNQRAEEAEIDKGDKSSGPLGGAEADQRIQAPEDRDHADNEEHQDVGWRKLVTVEEAIDKVCLMRQSVS